MPTTSPPSTSACWVVFFVYGTIMKTRNQWLLQHHRQVKRGEKPAGWLSVTVPAFTHHEEQNPDGTVTKWTTQETKVRKVPLYSHAQTKPYRESAGPSFGLSIPATSSLEGVSTSGGRISIG